MMTNRERVEELSEEIQRARAEVLTLQAERDLLGAESRVPARKHPLQHIATDQHGVVRFVENKIVSFLLDKGGYDLNALACMEFDQADREQFAQLIGYSVSGFGSLSYASDEAVAEADAVVRIQGLV